MPTLYEKYITGDTSSHTLNGSQKWLTQTFTPSIAHNINRVKLKLLRVGSPGTLTVSIKATDVDGKPTGADLASGTMDGNTITLTSPGDWYAITLGAGYDLVSGTKYAIVGRASSSDGSNIIYWRLDIYGTYSGGNVLYSTDSGSTWTANAGYDFMFEDWDTLYDIDPLTRVSGIRWVFDALPGKVPDYYMEVFLGGVTTSYVPAIGNAKPVPAIPPAIPPVVGDVMDWAANQNYTRGRPGLQYSDYQNALRGFDLGAILRAIGHIPSYAEWLEHEIARQR